MRTQTEVQEMISRLATIATRAEALPQMALLKGADERPTSCYNVGFKDNVSQIIDYLLPTLFWVLEGQISQDEINVHNKYKDDDCAVVVSLELWCDKVENRIDEHTTLIIKGIQ